MEKGSAMAASPRSISRRRFLAATVASAAVLSLPPALRDGQATTLIAGTRQIEVNGKSATVHGPMTLGEKIGLVIGPGEAFRVRLENGLSEPTLVHWHGLTGPWHQDGVPGLSQPALPPGQTYSYRATATASRSTAAGPSGYIPIRGCRSSSSSPRR
jgi:FtsP/CotA-like multicopper oxidase with cupredoxin domain